MDDYIKILTKFKIAYHSLDIGFDTKTMSKTCKPPSNWNKLTFKNSVYNSKMNSIIQLTGKPSGIIAIDVDGDQNEYNKQLISLCIEHCKFYNKTRKGYHFIFKYTNELDNNHNYKYPNDQYNSGVDIQATGKCIFYGSYKISDQIIKYENIIHQDIVDLPESVRKLLATIAEVCTNTGKKKTTAKPNIHTNILNSETTSNFPSATYLDCDSIDKLLNCLKPYHFITYNNWITMAFIIKNLNHTQHAFNLFTKYSRSIPQYSEISEQVLLNKWNTIKYCPDFKPEGLFYMARKDNPKLFNTIKLDLTTQNQQIIDTININTQYLEFNKIQSIIKQNTKKNNSKFIAIKSPYGTGKTSYINKLVKSIEWQNKNILFITPRTSLSYTIKKDFPDFTHYQTTDCLYAIEKLIIQLDSLPKMNLFNDIILSNEEYINELIENDSKTNDTFTYDLIILDEIESTLNHLAFSELDTYNVFNILTKLINNSKQTIALDGDFGQRGYQFLKSFLPPSVKPIIIENQYIVSPKHFKFTPDNDKFLSQIDKDLEDGLNLTVVSMTISYSEMLYQRFKDKYKTIIHNSIQNDKNILSNLNDEWYGIRLLIYTSTIETGCDFNREWFNKCYIVLSDKGTSPRALMQMISRIRKYTDNNIIVLLNGIPFLEFQIPYTYDEVLQNYFKSYINSTTKTLDPLLNILCHNKVESLNRQYFISILTNLLKIKGHTYEHIKDNIKIQKNNKQIYNNISIAPLVSNQEYENLLSSIKIHTTTGEQLRNAYFIIKKYILCNIWNIKDDELDADLAYKLTKLTRPLFNYKALAKYLETEDRIANTPEITQKQYEDELGTKQLDIIKRINYNLFINKINIIKKILTAFKVLHLDDFQYSIDCGTSSDGIKENQKNNPLVINKLKYTEIINSLTPILIDNKIRQIYEFKKIKNINELSEKQRHENIKYIINEFGLTINYFQKSLKITNEDGTITINKIGCYFIDIQNEIKDILYTSTHGIIDDVIDTINENNSDIILDF